VKRSGGCRPSAFEVIAGSPSRIRIEWPDNTIQNIWLQVIVKTNTHTGLASPAVFYVGHVLGEVNGSTPYRVTSADVSQITPFVSTAFVPITNPRDVNKDRRITSADISVVNPRVSTNIMLNNFTIPIAGSAAEGSGVGFGSLFLANERQGNIATFAVPLIVIPAASPTLTSTLGFASSTLVENVSRRFAIQSPSSIAVALTIYHQRLLLQQRDLFNRAAKSLDTESCLKKSTATNPNNVAFEESSLQPMHPVDARPDLLISRSVFCCFYGNKPTNFAEEPKN